MQASTPGIVLRKVAYSGSAVIATIYTKRYGTLPFIVRGGSGKRSKGAKSLSPSALQALAQIDIAFAYREKNRIQTADHLGISKIAMAHSSHPVRSAVCLFLAEVLYRSLREEAPDPDLFDFISSALDFFHEGDFDPGFHLVFLMKLSGFFGFPVSSDWESSRPYFDLQNGVFTQNYAASLYTLNKELSFAFSELADSDFGQSLNHKKALRNALLDAMIVYFRLHIEGLGELKSVPVLREVFA